MLQIWILLLHDRVSKVFSIHVLRDRKQPRKSVNLPATIITVYASECNTASNVDTLATQRWKLLYVAKSHPVSHIRALFRIPNSHIRGRFAVEIIPVRSAK